jgi:hypothetical protein
MLTFQSLAVPVFTTTLKTQNHCIYCLQCIYVFVCLRKKNTITSLYRIKVLVPIIALDIVLCGRKTEFLNAI